MISGLSGAGKSQAAQVFEDLGYSVVDNLPAALLENSSRCVDRIASDTGAPHSSSTSAPVTRARDRAGRDRAGWRPTRSRSAFSRRGRDARQPLQRDAPTAPAGRTQRGPGLDRRGASAFTRTRELADHVVDTTGLSIGQLKDRLWSLVPQRDDERAASRHRHLRLQVRGAARGGSVLDVRFLTNPYWDPELKPPRASKRRSAISSTANRFLELVTSSSA